VEESLFGWCVELRESKRVIGTCALFECELDKRVAEVSYEILQNYWGQGLTSELLPPLIEYGFKTLDLNRVNAFVDTRNIVSLKLLAKNYFQREGLMRESWIDEDGQPVDEYVLGGLPNEIGLHAKVRYNKASNRAVSPPVLLALCPISNQS
jgi:ribosomal-protein-alanine N-acetyltransferase